MNNFNMDVVFEDLDELVEYARTSYSMAGFLSVVSSATILKKALEKQIPKKLKSKEFLTGYYCQCGASIPFQKQKYCCECGQRLDWKGLDNY